MESIPLFQVEKEMYMESNLEMGDIRLGNLERKIAIQEATPNYMFLLYTVSVLSKSCRFVKDAAQS